MATSFLTPGPSELYYTVADHLKVALREHVCEISHRSKAFQQIMAHTTAQLRELMGVPDHFHIAFTGSATEIWERILQNLCAETSFHLVNGSFSKKFYDFARQLQRKALKYEVPLGQGFWPHEIDVPAGTELLCLTQNETSTGVTMPLADLATLRQKYPHLLIAVDAVSSAPYPAFDFAQFDTLFFSVQKCFGLPAGLGVWLFNDRCVAKAEQLAAQGHSLGTYHTIPSLLSNLQKNETPETPNMLGIYLLGKVAEDLNRRGIKTIRQETDYKASLMYHALEQHPQLSAFVGEPTHRSRTVVVANVLGRPAADLLALAKAQQIIVGSGYGSLKDSQLRIANFPTHSKEVFEKLADLLLAS
ncbi:MAG: aminotransferase class V-fold PLP-dependent enzyme [Bernardetiaceae bacterium]|nr:aminotransferase class V-fold PLP-dependent enzyme [Bernardetiaceae bacterium]